MECVTATPPNCGADLDIRAALVGNDRDEHIFAPNLLGRNFIAAAPNRIWLADIIYIETDQGWLYLATVLDLYRCVGNPKQVAVEGAISVRLPRGWGRFMSRPCPFFQVMVGTNLSPTA